MGKADPQTTANVVFADCRFYFSMTLEHAEWLAIIAALRSSGRSELADKVQTNFGLRPE